MSAGPASRGSSTVCLLAWPSLQATLLPEPRRVSSGLQHVVTVPTRLAEAPLCQAVAAFRGGAGALTACLCHSRWLFGGSVRMWARRASSGTCPSQDTSDSGQDCTVGLSRACSCVCDADSVSCCSGVRGAETPVGLGGWRLSAPPGRLAGGALAWLSSLLPQSSVFCPQTAGWGGVAQVCVSTGDGDVSTSFLFPGRARFSAGFYHTWVLAAKSL